MTDRKSSTEADGRPALPPRKPVVMTGRRPPMIDPTARERAPEPATISGSQSSTTRTDSNGKRDSMPPALPRRVAPVQVAPAPAIVERAPDPEEMNARKSTAWYGKDDQNKGSWLRDGLLDNLDSMDSFMESLRSDATMADDDGDPFIPDTPDRDSRQLSEAGPPVPRRPVRFTTSLTGDWAGRTAGGCTAHATCMNNPQYRLTVSRPTLVTISLSQVKNQGKPLAAIGVVVGRANGGRITQGMRESDILTTSGVYRVAGEVRCTPLQCDPQCVYTILASTFMPNVEASYALLISSSAPVEVAMIEPAPMVMETESATIESPRGESSSNSPKPAEEEVAFVEFRLIGPPPPLDVLDGSYRSSVLGLADRELGRLSVAIPMQLSLDEFRDDASVEAAMLTTSDVMEVQPMTITQPPAAPGTPTGSSSPTQAATPPPARGPPKPPKVRKGSVADAADHAIREFLASEVTYVAYLVDLIRNLIDPLREKAMGALAILSTEEIAAIFTFLENVLIFNRDMLLPALKACYADKQLHEVVISEVITKFMKPMQKFYLSYVSHYTAAMNVFVNKKSTNPFFERACEEFRQKAAAGFEVHTYLLMPVQRVPRYRILLAEILRLTTPDTFDDHAALTALVPTLTSMAEEITATISRVENERRMYALQERFVGPSLNVTIPGRYLIREGPVDLRQGKSKEAVILVLFSDSILYCRPVKGNLSQLQHGELKSLSGASLQIPQDKSVSAMWRVQFAGGIGWLLSAPTVDSREDWIKVITETITRNELDNPMDKDDAHDLVVSHEGPDRVLVVKAASLDRMVERLTHDKVMDNMFCRVFTLTFRCYITPSKLMQKLVERFCLACPVGMAQAPYESKMTTIRKKVANLIKGWMMTGYRDFDTDEIIASVKEFITIHMPAKGLGQMASSLNALFNTNVALVPTPGSLSRIAIAMRDRLPVGERSALGNTNPVRDCFYGSEAVEWLAQVVPDCDKAGAVALCQQMVDNKLIRPAVPGMAKFNEGQVPFKFTWTAVPYPIGRVPSNAPAPLVPPNHEKYDLNSLLEFSPKEVARQLTLMAHTLYANIDGKDLILYAWKAEQEKPGLSLEAYFNHVSQITSWVAASIVSPNKLEDRKKILRLFIRLGHDLREVKNLATCHAVYKALRHPAVASLSRVWESVDRTDNIMMQGMTALFNPANKSKALREEHDIIAPPCVPEIAIYITDLSVIMSRHPDEQLDGLVNFQKFRISTFLVDTALRCQNAPFAYRPVDHLRQLLEDVNGMRDEQLHRLAAADAQVAAAAGTGSGGASPTIGGPSENTSPVVAALEQEEGLRRRSSTGKRLLKSLSTSTLAPASPAAVRDTADCMYVEGTTESAMPVIKAATVRKLVERLTDDKHSDLALIRTFMLSYRAFASPTELFKLLEERFCFQPPADMTPADAEAKQKLVRLRIGTVLKNWLNNYYRDFRRDAELVTRLTEFVSDTMPREGMHAMSANLQALFNRNVALVAVDQSLDRVAAMMREKVSRADRQWIARDGRTGIMRRSFVGAEAVDWMVASLPDVQNNRGIAVALGQRLMEQHLMQGAPDVDRFFDAALLYKFSTPPVDHGEDVPAVSVPAAYKSMGLPQLVEAATREVARQLTLLHHELFVLIDDKDLLGHAWRRAGFPDRIPRSVVVAELLFALGELSRWVTTIIVQPPRLEQRRNMLASCIRLAQELRALHNFAGCCAVLQGVSHPAVSRLRKTWDRLDREVIQVKVELDQLFAAHDKYKLLDEAQAAAVPSSVPYLNLYIHRLVEMEKTIPPEVNGLVNFDKYRQINDLIDSALRWQSPAYKLQRVTYVRNLAEDIMGDSDDVLHATSMRWEATGETDPPPSRMNSMASAAQSMSGQYA